MGLCLVYYFAWFRPHEQKRRQQEERRKGNQLEEHRSQDDVIELETLVIHRFRDRDRDHDQTLGQSKQIVETHSESRSQKSSPARVDDGNRTNAPEYNPLRMHASMNDLQHALPGPPVLPPVFHLAQPRDPFMSPGMPPPPRPPPSQPVLSSPNSLRRPPRGRPHRRNSQGGRVRHPSPGHATTISDDRSDRGGSLPPTGRQGHSVSRSPTQSRSVSPGHYPTVSPTQDSMEARMSGISSSLYPMSGTCLDDLVENAGELVSPIQQNLSSISPTTDRSGTDECNDHAAVHRRQSALLALESDMGVRSVSTEHASSGPPVHHSQSRNGPVNRSHEINRGRDSNGPISIHPANNDPSRYESRIGRRHHRENQIINSSDSGSGSATKEVNTEPVTQINSTRIPINFSGFGAGESRVGRRPNQRHNQQRQDPEVSRNLYQLTGESRLGRSGYEIRCPLRQTVLDNQGPPRPIPESRIGERRRSPPQDFRERSAARRASRRLLGVAGESRIGQRSSSSSQSYRHGVNELSGEGRGGYRRPGRIQDSPTFSNLVPLQLPRSRSRSGPDGERRSSPLLRTSFFNNSLPEPNHNRSRSVNSQASSTGAVCSFDSDSDSTQRLRRATSLGGGSIFQVNTNTSTNGPGPGPGYDSRGGNRSASGPGSFPSGGGARD